MKASRTITTKECPWLDEDIQKDTELHYYPGYTYGCITDKGVAVTTEKNILPFFEVPVHLISQ